MTLTLACVADESRIPTPRELPGFSIVASNWLFHMVVLSCSVVGRVHLVKHGGDHSRSVEISLWSGEKQLELSDNLPEQQESLKVFWGSDVFVNLPTGDCHGYCCKTCIHERYMTGLHDSCCTQMCILIFAFGGCYCLGSFILDDLCQVSEYLLSRH